MRKNREKFFRIRTAFEALRVNFAPRLLLEWTIECAIANSARLSRNIRNSLGAVLACNFAIQTHKAAGDGSGTFGAGEALWMIILVVNGDELSVNGVVAL